MTLKGTATVATTDVTESTRTAEVLLEFIDPCDPPLAIYGPVLTNQVYTLTDDSKAPYTVPDFVVSPSFCKVEYTYTKTDLLAGDSAVELTADTDKTFEFFYNKDLAPLSQVQTVTVTATSTSDQGVFFPRE